VCALGCLASVQTQTSNIRLGPSSVLTRFRNLRFSEHIPTKSDTFCFGVGAGGWGSLAVPYPSWHVALGSDCGSSLTISACSEGYPHVRYQGDSHHRQHDDSNECSSTAKNAKIMMQQGENMVLICLLSSPFGSINVIPHGDEPFCNYCEMCVQDGRV